ncbi:AraC family transcriptional regulator [Sporomusa malonica]|nr:AraC family transcriptional regulator [Sporomusa malonica]
MARYFSNINVSIVNVIRGVVPPGGKCFGVFTPPFSGLIFPLRGRARMSFDGVPYVMDPGKVFNSGPNMALDKEVLGQSEWDFMVIHYRVDDSEKGAFSYGLSHYQLDPGHSTRINNMLHRLYQLCAMPGSLPALRAKSLFFSILDEILTCCGKPRNESDRELIGQAREYMESHYMETLTVPKMAGQYGLSSKQFAYLFQKYAGMGPTEYLIEYRVRRAKELLCTTAATVAEISTCVGYSDPYYFSKLFKKRTGFCPSMLQSHFGENIK